MATTKTFKPAGDPKPCTDFRPDAAQGKDWRGWQRCLSCRHWGDRADPRDRRHPANQTQQPPAAPRSRRARQIIAAAAEIDARILGEHDPE